MNEHDQAVLFSSAKSDWGTPQWLYDRLNSVFQFRVDWAAHAGNAKHKAFVGPGGTYEDAIALDWHMALFQEYGTDLYRTEKTNGWLNPPYGDPAFHFVHKATVESRDRVATVLLLPARTDTQLFHRFCKRWPCYFFEGRLIFEGRNEKGEIVQAGAPFPSMLNFFNCSDEQLHAFSKLDLNPPNKRRRNR